MNTQKSANDIEKQDDAILHFPTRLRSHMDTYGFSRVNPAGNEKDYWQNIIKNGSSENNRRTVYIHIPFCSTLCTFCNFMRKAGTSAMAADYAKMVIKEMQYYKDSGYSQQGKFEALYFGGGTPSLLPADSIAEITETARQIFNLEKNTEFTIESTIHDLCPEKLKSMAQAGINRISLGVQTFNTDMRRKLGRISDKQQIYKIIQTARAEGIKTISADILYRLPGEDIKFVQEDIKVANELNIDGLSLYPLIAMEGTPLDKGLKNSSISALPDIYAELEQYKTAKSMLTDAGYIQNTSTHFVQPTDKNLYANIRLDDGDCLGIGSSAGGYLGALVIMNAMDKQMYNMQISSGKQGYMISILLPSKSRMLRSITGQLQRGFINLDSIWNDHSLDIQSAFQDKIDKYQDKGLLTKDGKSYKLTEDGWFWCYNIAADFANDGRDDNLQNDSMPLMATGKKVHPHMIKYGGKNKPDSSGFSMKDISVLGVMTALVVVIQFSAAMLMHLTAVALIPGLMQFVMAFLSCIILFTALKKVPKTGALSIMSAVYSLVTMLLSGSIVMGFGLIIGGLFGDLAAKMLGGIKKTLPLIIALVIYRTTQTTFSKLYAFITEMTQIQFVWYLIVLSIIASAVGALAGSLAGIKLTAKISKAGVMG